VNLQSLENLSSRLGAELQKNNMFFTCAESCTGGLLSQSIVSVAGSSRWFGCSFVTYSNHSKSKVLGVSKDTLNSFGAVSEEVVSEMVEGALRESKANLGIAISGIAGPSGGTPARPVGTVCIAWKLDQASTIRETFLFEGNRNEVRYQTVFKALEVAIELVN